MRCPGNELACKQLLSLIIANASGKGGESEEDYTNRPFSGINFAAAVAATIVVVVRVAAGARRGGGLQADIDDDDREGRQGRRHMRRCRRRGDEAPTEQGCMHL